MTTKVYLVGGAVRDRLLDRPVTESDYVVVGSNFDTLKSLGFVQVGSDFPVFLHPNTHDEYALARTERKSGKGYKGFSVHTDSVSLEDDLMRRDLTINAMAIEVGGLFDSDFKHGNFAKEHIIDPYGGLDDLKNRQLRHICPAFCEDPVRVLRLARFLARYAPKGFKIANSTKNLVQKMHDDGELNHLVAERIWAETVKALSEDWADMYFTTLKKLGVLATIMPALDSVFDDFTITKYALRLVKISSHYNDLLIKFGLIALCFIRKPHSFKNFCQTLKIPKQYQAFGQMLLVHFNDLERFDELNSNQLFELIKATNFLKLPNKLDDLLRCITLYKFAKQQRLLDNIHYHLNKISQKDIDQTLTGKAIGQAIDELKKQKLDQLLS